MKKIYLVVLSLFLLVALCGVPRQAVADEYDDSQSHPLRVAAYIAHPVGILVEWLLARPFHFLVSATPQQEYIFGHRPHPPILVEPQPLHDYGVPRRVPTKEGPTPRVSSPQEPTSERVTIKEVVLEKHVLKEMPKVIEIEKIVFPSVAFRFDSADLADLGKGQVYLVAQRLKENPNTLIMIEGHADYVGSNEYNMRLGLRRAEVVKRELTQLGIEADRLSTASLGESKPLIEQQADWARAVNRRVDLKPSSR